MPLGLTRLQERFRSYWGIETALIHALGRAARDCGAEAVVVVGLSVLPYLAGVQGRQRVWYAADEWAWHHLSQVRLFSPSTWPEIRAGCGKRIVRAGLRVVAGSSLGRHGGRPPRHALGRRHEPNRCDPQRRGWRTIPSPRSAANRAKLRLLGAARFRTEYPGDRVVLQECLAGGPIRVARRHGSRSTASTQLQPVLAFANRDGVKVVGDLPDLRIRGGPPSSGCVAVCQRRRHQEQTAGGCGFGQGHCLQSAGMWRTPCSGVTPIPKG